LVPHLALTPHGIGQDEESRSDWEIGVRFGEIHPDPDRAVRIDGPVREELNLGGRCVVKCKDGGRRARRHSHLIFQILGYRAGAETVFVKALQVTAEFLGRPEIVALAGTDMMIFDNENFAF
jgi:hypothetical protein